MDRFLIRRGSTFPQTAKRRCVATGSASASVGAIFPGGRDDTASAVPGGDPHRIISWNVNGLAVQLKNEWSVVRAFLEREQPDVFCLQEVRLAAAGPLGCKRGDGKRRRRGEAKQETKQEREEWQLIERTLLAAMQADYTVHWSLADWKYAGTAMFIRRPLRPSHVSYTLPSLAGCHDTAHQDPANPQWHPEGRIILAAFETFDLLATYAPNNGTDHSSFARRAAWDRALHTELSARSRPLVWIGDVNCTAEEVDVSHPEWFLRQGFQEQPEDMRGQPGFTLGERRRFRELLDASRLIDAYRWLHPASASPPSEGPHYTWRGHPPINQPVAKYHGKGMRIDCSLVAQELIPRVEEAGILGHGSDRLGFMGSDHSPIRLVLRNAPTARPDHNVVSAPLGSAVVAID